MKNRPNHHVAARAVWRGWVACAALVMGLAAAQSAHAQTGPDFPASAEIAAQTFSIWQSITPITLVAADDGVAPVAYTLTSGDTSIATGARIAGLIYTAGAPATISGTPSAAFDDTLTYTATDANGATDSLIFEMTIEAPAFEQDLYSYTFTVGTAAQLDLPVVSGIDVYHSYGEAFGVRIDAQTNPPQLIADGSAAIGVVTFDYAALGRLYDMTKIEAVIIAGLGADLMPSYTFTAGTAMTFDMPSVTGATIYTAEIAANAGYGVDFSSSPPKLYNATTLGNSAYTQYYTFDVTVASAADTASSSLSSSIPVELVVFARLTFPGVSANGRESVLFNRDTETAVLAYTFRATGGLAPRTYSIDSAVSSGLTSSANADGFSIQGKLVAGVDDDRTITVTDANGATATLEIALKSRRGDEISTLDVLQAFAYYTFTAGTATTFFPSADLTGDSDGLEWVFSCDASGIGCIGDNDAGDISGVFSTAGTAAGVAVTIHATDIRENRAFTTLYFVVVPAPSFDLPPVVAVPADNSTTPYTFTAKHGRAPLAYALDPALPSATDSGITFSSAGVLSGTGSLLGKQFVITATDRNGAVGAATFLMSTLEAPAFAQAEYDYTFTAGTAKQINLPRATQGAFQSYSAGAITAAGFTFSAGAAFAADTAPDQHQTPTLSADQTSQAGDFTFTLSADASGYNPSASIRVHIAAALAFPANAPTAFTFTAGEAVDLTFSQVNGGVAPMGYGISGDLPDGLAFDAPNNAPPRIFGTPSAMEESAVTLQAIDASGAMAQLAMTMTVFNVPVFSPAIINVTYTVGSPYYTSDDVTPRYALELTLPAAQIAAGSLSYTVSGTLNGLAATLLSDNQVVISGTPTSAGAVVYQRIVTSDNGLTATFVANLNILNSPTPLFLATQGDLSFTAAHLSTYSLISAIGGNGALAYSLSRVGGSTNAFDLVSASRELRSKANLTVADAGQYILVATDTVNARGETTFNVVVAAKLEFPQSASPVFTYRNTDQVFDFTLANANGGQAAVTYVLTSAGEISADSTFADLSYAAASGTTPARLVGTPISRRTTMFTYAATDANGATDMFAFTLQTLTQPSFTPTGPVALSYTQNDPTHTSGGTTNDEAITLPSAISGDTLAYTIGGALPSGMISTALDGGARLVISGAPSVAGNFTFHHIATDSVPHVNTYTVTIYVAAAPVFAAAQGKLHATLNFVFSNHDLPSVNGGYGTLNYALAPTLPGGLAYTSPTRISGTPSVLNDVGNATYTLTATDAHGAQTELLFELEIYPPLAFQSGNPQELTYTVDTPKTASFLPATGGRTPLTYSMITSGNAGLTFDADARVLSGSFTAAPSGTTQFNYTVTDANGAFLHYIFRYVVVGAPRFTTANENALKAGYSFRAGTAIAANTNLPTALAGALPLTYKLTIGADSQYGAETFAHANGITFDVATRTLSGTPTAQERITTHLRYHARDANATDAAENTHIFIAPTLGIGGQVDLTFGTRQENVDISLSRVEDEVDNVTYSLNGLNGAILPAGLTLNPTAVDAEFGAQLGGTTGNNPYPPATFVYTATDDYDGAQAHTTFSITVQLRPVFTPPQLVATYTQNESRWTADDGASGGETLTLPFATHDTLPLSYTVDGNLPNGVTATDLADDALELSDAPSVVGDFTYIRIATDSNSRSDTFTLTLHVNPRPSFDDSPARLSVTPGGRQDDVQLPIVSGGSGAISYAISPSAARSGLTVVLDGATAMLTYGASVRTSDGEETTPGIYQYELTAIDANGATVSLTFDIQVHEGLAFAKDFSDIGATYTIGVPLTLPAAEGGLEPYAFEISYPDKGADDFPRPLNSILVNPGLVVSDDTASPLVIDGPLVHTGRLAENENFTLSYTVTDANGATTNQLFTFNIVPMAFVDGSPPQAVDVLELDFNVGVVTTHDISATYAGGTDNYVAYQCIGVHNEGCRDYTELSEPSAGLNFYVDEGLTFVGSNEAGGVHVVKLISSVDYGKNFEGVKREYVMQATYMTTVGGAFAPTEFVKTLTISINLKSPDRFKALNDEVLPKVAVAAVAGTIGAITDRIANISAAPRLAIGGQSPVMAFANNAKAWVDQTLDGKKLLSGSSFVMPLGAHTGDDVAAQTQSAAAVWGSANYRELSGDANLIDWSGNMLSIHLGMDAPVAPNLRAGFAVTQSETQIDYTNLTTPLPNRVQANSFTVDAAKGDYTVDVIAAYPYVSWQNENTSLWASLGGGAGELTISELGETHKADLGLLAGGMGVNSYLSPQLQLRVELQAGAMDIKENDDETILDQDISTSTARAGLRWHRLQPTVAGAVRQSNVQLGVRQDGGDGAKGSAVEAGLGWNYRRSRVTLETGMYTLLGNAEYREHGLYGQLRVVAGADGQGLAIDIRPSYGDSAQQYGKMWDAETFADLDANDEDYAMQTEARLSYGWQGAHGLLAPFFDVTTATDDTYRLGLDWSPTRRVQVNLTGQHQQESGVDEQSVLLKGEVRF